MKLFDFTMGFITAAVLAAALWVGVNQKDQAIYEEVPIPSNVWLTQNRLGFPPGTDLSIADSKPFAEPIAEPIAIAITNDPGKTDQKAWEWAQSSVMPKWEAESPTGIEVIGAPGMVRWLQRLQWQVSAGPRASETIHTLETVEIGLRHDGTVVWRVYEPEKK